METSTVLFQLISNHLFLQDLIGQIVELSDGLVAADDSVISVNSDITPHSIRQ